MIETREFDRKTKHAASFIYSKIDFKCAPKIAAKPILNVFLRWPQEA